MIQFKMGIKQPYCVRLPRWINSPVANYNREVAEIPTFTKAFSKKQAISHVLYRSVGSLGVGKAMNYLKENKADPKEGLSKYLVSLEDFEVEVAINKTEGPLMDIEELPEVTHDELAEAASKRLGGFLSDYKQIMRSYFSSQ